MRHPGGAPRQHLGASAGRGANAPRIGLFNVRQRLRFLYGEDCGIELLSKAGEGATCRISLPV